MSESRRLLLLEFQPIYKQNFLQKRGRTILCLIVFYVLKVKIYTNNKMEFLINESKKI